MYIHVPAAWLSLQIYVVMAICSFVSLVYKHSLADIISRSCAPIGATYTFITLITGSIWGKPTWGDKNAAILTLVGIVNLPIIKWSVDWWNTLHQPASIMKLDSPSIDSEMLTPLFFMAISFFLIFLSIMLTRISTEIIVRKIEIIKSNF